jgi:hypothetical protein
MVSGRKFEVVLLICQIQYVQDVNLSKKICLKNGKKAVPLQAYAGPEGSRRLSFPDFLTIGT